MNSGDQQKRAAQIRIYYRGRGVTKPQQKTRAPDRVELPASFPVSSPPVTVQPLSTQPLPELHRPETGKQATSKIDALEQYLPIGANAVGSVVAPYVVQPGDTLFSIARRFMIPLSRLRAANKEITDDDIFIGQIINLPLREPALPPLLEVYEPFVAQPGDTLHTIAERFGVFPEAVQAANPTLDPEIVIPGTVVFVPMVAEAPPVPLPAMLYVVQPGDTLEEIAEAFNRSLVDIRRANPQITGDDIFPGEFIVIPVGAPPSEPLFNRIRYVIQPGDTLASIAEQFLVPVQQLQETNVFLAPVAGLVISVPLEIPTPAPPPTREGFPRCIAAPFGRRLDLADDDSVFVEFPPGFDFRFFGHLSPGGVYVNSNGTLTFNQEDTSFIASTDAFLEGPPRIAGLWVDLIPERTVTPGGIFVTSVEDEQLGGTRFVITWDRVPLFSARDLYQTFQISLNPDHSISICYFQVTPPPSPDVRTLIGVGGGAEVPVGNVFLFDGDTNPRRLGPSAEATPTGPLSQRTLLYTFDEATGNYRLSFT